jgi:uncharacterized Zn-binding protein involved in type VI secretion
MGKPAAFMGSLHVCPSVTVIVPHVGGPVIGTAATVLVGGPPAATIGDISVCVGPPDAVAATSVTVMAQGKPMARMTDPCGHGGKIMLGMPTIIVGD